ncbi:MAG: hypothetical protein ACR2OD_04445 [Gaiellaceae bacterium]
MTGYLAFGRTRYDEPLRQLGTIDADPGQAPAEARARFEDELIELTLLPDSEIVWVLQPENTDE